MPVQVTKVGRDWAQVKGVRYERISLATLSPDCKGHTPQGRCWLSLEALKDHRQLDRTWNLFRAAVSNTYYCPAGVTVDSITRAAEQLGIPLTLECPAKDRTSTKTAFVSCRLSDWRTP